MPWNASNMFPWLTGQQQKKPKPKGAIQQQRDQTNAAMDELFGPAPVKVKKR